MQQTGFCNGRDNRFKKVLSALLLGAGVRRPPGLTYVVYHAFKEEGQAAFQSASEKVPSPEQALERAFLQQAALHAW